MPGQQELKQQIVAFIETAEQQGEIAACEFKNLVGGLFGDYLFAVIAYWLQDDSDEFSDTTQLVDLTLAILVLALKSGIVNKLTELAGFMLRNQLSRWMQNGSGLLDVLRVARNGLGSVSA
ncbi:MAG: TetR/AcrR family transcriptional regulator, partial [Burkholderiales bacterium]|nr:TetR/AcrR family transcriptional regulator [Burkholderiales bacterium]